MADKKQDKQLKVTIRTLVEVLDGESRYRDESLKLKRLGMETGPDLEDALLALKEALEDQALSAEQLAHRLTELLTGQPVPVFGAVVDVLTRQVLADTRPGSVLQALFKLKTGAEGLRLLGLAFHRLQLAGKHQPTTSVAATTKGRPALPEAWISPPGFEDRLILFVFTSDSGGEALYQLGLKEGRGLDAANTDTTTPRKRRRELIELTRHKNQLEPVAISPELLLFLLDEAISISRDHHLQVPFDVLHLAQDLKEIHGITPCGYQPADPSWREPRYFLANEEFGQLLRLSEVKTWGIPQDQLEQAVEKMAERLSSSLTLTPDLERQLINDEQERMINNCFTPARREIYARRLELTALRCEQRGDLEVVPWLYGSALACRDLSKSARDITFLRFFFELHLTIFLQSLQPALEQELDQTGLSHPEPSSGLLAPNAGPSVPDKDEPRIILASR